MIGLRLLHQPWSRLDRRCFLLCVRLFFLLAVVAIFDEGFFLFCYFYSPFVYVCVLEDRRARRLKGRPLSFERTLQYPPLPSPWPPLPPPSLHEEPTGYLLRSRSFDVQTTLC